MKKKKQWEKKKSGLYGLFDKKTRMKSKEYYPLLMFSIVASAIILGLFIVFLIAYPLFIRPYYQQKSQQQATNTSIGQQDNAIRPPLIDTVQEYLFKIRYINQPVKYGDEIICTGGSDSAGNPKLASLYLYNINDRDNNAIVSEIKCQNDHLLYPQFNDRWILVVDAAEKGGGNISCFDRVAKSYSIIKEYRGAPPKIRLEGERLVWFEQTSADLSTLYSYHISTDQLTAHTVQENLPFVYGGADVAGSTAVWSGLDSRDKLAEDMRVTNRSAIYTLNLDTGEQKRYEPGMFAYAPSVYGDLIAWIDTTGKPSSSLYISQNGSQPRKLAGNVSGFDVGDGYVVYCQDDRMYVYFVDGDTTLPISKEGQRCFYIGEQNGVAFWYDTTQDYYQRDVVKYVELERDGWQR